MEGVLKIHAVMTGALLLFAPMQTFAQTPSPSPAVSAAPSAAPSATPPAPGETATIAVPAGWTEKPVTMSMGSFVLDHMWMPDDPKLRGDNINLGHTDNPTGMTIDALGAQTKAIYDKILGPENVAASRAQKLCNGAANGWYIQTHMIMGAMNLVMEQMMVVGKTRVFGATYTRKNGAPEDPAARKALDSLCPAQ
jgi:hypothetical protein